MKKNTFFFSLLIVLLCWVVFAEDNCKGDTCITDDWSIYMSWEENSEINILLLEGLTWVNLTWNLQTQNLNNTGSNTEEIKEFKDTWSESLWVNQLDEAILRWYNNEITMYNSISDFMADHALLREDSSKLLYQTARILWYVAPEYNECSFSDINTVSESLKSNITQICKAWGLMKGDKGEFFPFRNLTNAEAITVIARIAGIQDTSTTSARWSPYLAYVKQLWILNGTDIYESTMDKVITRWQLIILLHRLGKVYDKYYGDFWAAINNPTNKPIGESPSNVSVGAGIVDTPRFTNALLWMYNNSMTLYRNASDYDPFNTMTKEQSAKVLSIYYDTFIDEKPTPITCIYKDIGNSTLKAYIENVCKYKIFPNTDTFKPSENILKSEFVKALLVMVGDITNESTTEQVIEEALDSELITASDLSTFNKPITRYEVAMMLHTLYLKNIFIDNLTQESSTYYIISPTSDQLSGSNNEQRSFIDINTIDSKDFNNGYINLFGKTYKLNKKETINYFPTSYSRYGTISDTNTDNIVGTITMAIWQKSWTKVVLEWYIIFQNTSNLYTITPTSTIPYYTIKKIK